MTKLWSAVLADTLGEPRASRDVGSGRLRSAVDFLGARTFPPGSGKDQETKI
ncbi:MAG: hypothetical protein NT056_01380 [Proteobacteria bacterium]|nr:hypothetical protein [Pseudomonadota bacterium]